MTTPPKDKPVAKDEEVGADQDNLQSDESVAAADTAIEYDAEREKEGKEQQNESTADLNTDNNDVGLNNEQGEEFL